MRETVAFSAKLRLESTDPAVTPESTEAFINQTLTMLELTDIEDLQVCLLSFFVAERASLASIFFSFLITPLLVCCPGWNRFDRWFVI